MSEDGIDRISPFGILNETMGLGDSSLMSVNITRRETIRYCIFLMKVHSIITYEIVLPKNQTWIFMFLDLTISLFKKRYWAIITKIHGHWETLQKNKLTLINSVGEKRNAGGIYRSKGTQKLYQSIAVWGY